MNGVRVQSNVWYVGGHEEREISSRPGSHNNDSVIVVSGRREVAVQDCRKIDDSVGGVEPLLAEGAVQATVGGSRVVGDGPVFL